MWMGEMAYALVLETGSLPTCLVVAKALVESPCADPLVVSLRLKANELTVQLIAAQELFDGGHPKHAWGVARDAAHGRTKRSDAAPSRRANRRNSATPSACEGVGWSRSSAREKKNRKIGSHGGCGDGQKSAVGPSTLLRRCFGLQVFVRYSLVFYWPLRSLRILLR